MDLFRGDQTDHSTFSMLRLPELQGFTLYDLLNLYLRGIVKGLTSRAASLRMVFLWRFSFSAVCVEPDSIRPKLFRY